MKIFVNILTIFRLIVSLFIASLFSKLDGIAFVILIALIFLTDFIDGVLARKYNVQTTFGSIIDVLADKAICISLIIILINYNKIFIYIAIFELLIFIINVISVLLGKHVKTLKVGKIKMWIISILIILGYIYVLYNINKNIIIYAGIFTCIMQAITLICYIHYLIKQKSKIIDKSIIHKLFDTEYYKNFNDKLQ